MSDRPTVFIRNLSKIYLIGSKGSEKSIFQRRNRTEVEALKKTSFVAYSGESIGILGRNGSGKTTLLNLIAGNESPTSGEVLVSSDPTYLGISAALQDHLSGELNVRLGLLAMGLSPEEVTSMEKDVLEWAELEEAGERPFKTYSSGMKARLKFSIATAVRREILLIDEALSTGDSTFSAKANARIKDFLKNSGTIFLVSHAPGSIEKHCKRAIWLHKGEIIADGSTRFVTKYYRIWAEREANGNFLGSEKIISSMKRQYSEKNLILDSEAVSILDNNS